MVDETARTPNSHPSGTPLAEPDQASPECIPNDDGEDGVQVVKSKSDANANAGDGDDGYQFVNSPAPIPVGTPESGSLQMARKLFSEFLGTCLLVMVVVGSGIMGETLSEDNVGVQLLINSIATVGGLFCLITILGPVSGAHFNPIVSMVDRLYGDMPTKVWGYYAVVQCAGAILGATLANFMFDIPTTLSEKDRFSPNLWISELVATATLITVIHGCLRTGNEATVAYAVSAWVGGGYFFTSSTIFANPAVTIGRMFSNTFAGIQPKSAGVFICFQIIGALIGYGLVRFLYPSAPKQQPLVASDDPLYRRAYVLVHQDFFANNNMYLSPEDNATAAAAAAAAANATNTATKKE